MTNVVEQSVIKRTVVVDQKVLRLTRKSAPVVQVARADNLVQVGAPNRVIEVLIGPRGPKGDPGTGGGGGASFLPPPDLTSEAADFFYFGWVDVDGAWRIHRQSRLSGAVGRANGAGTAEYADLTSAWANRTLLTYA